MRTRTAASLFAIAALGCGGDDSPPTCASDSGAACVSDDGGSGRSVVDIPWLADGVPPIAPPDLACPMGWREVPAADAEGVATCDPYPEGGPLDCPDGQAHFPGEPGCADVGSPCPAGDFAEGLPTDRRVVYVQPGATGGDGASPASPHGSLTAFSIGGLPMGTVIALSRGTHQGPVRLVREIGLRGACAADTIVTTDVPADLEGVVTIRDAGGGVRDATLADSPRPGAVVLGPASLDGVVVRNATQSGILAVDTSLTARGLVVEATRPARDRQFGRGLSAEIGTTADVSRAVFERNREFAVHAGEAGAALVLADVSIRDSEPQELDGTGGRGLNVQGSATADATRISLSRNRQTGVVATGADTSATLTDVVVRDTRSQLSDLGNGHGIEISVGARALVSRALVERNRGVAVATSNAGTSVTLADLVVRDTQSREAGGRFGRGVSAQQQATVEVTRALVERNREYGVVVTGGADTTLTLTDVVVRESLPRDADGASGRGVGVEENTAATLERVLVDRNVELGIYVGDAGSTLTASDLLIRDTHGRSIDGLGGRGLNVQTGATANGTRVILERNRGVAIYAGGSSTGASMTDLVIRETLARDCAVTSCTDTPAGHGAGSYDEAVVSIRGFLIERSNLCGVHLATSGQIDLASGDVRDNPIGACVQEAGYDLARLMSEVRFTDNGVNLDATTLPVPEPAVELETGP